MKGVFGKYLVIDLDNQGFEEFDVPKSWYEKYFGGRGVAARIIYSEMPEKIDAFDSRNLLVFSTGPLQGTGLPGAGRNLVMAKSPKTGSVSDSFVGGFFPHELGRSGYDGLVIKGKADSPKYITVNENDIRDADDLWGKETAEVENTLRKRHDGGRVCSIGVAGEKKVNFACVINDRNRAAGRPGFGAVMGDKNLKAIIVKGEKDKPIYDKEGFEEKKKRFTEALSSSPVVDWGKYGSTSTLLSLNEIGSLPTENFKKGEFEDAEEISGEQMYEKILVERDNCTSCPVRCKRVVSTEFNDEKVEEKYGGPEYETLASFGSLCRNSDLDSIALANQLCNKYGLDTISTGNIISSLMEASEKKTIDFEVEWGDPEKIIELIEKIAKRKGIGDELAKGMNYIKNELDVPGLEVKGQEVPMHEPRAKKALALSYATSPRGATHLETMHDTLSKHPRELPIHGEISRFDLEHKPRFCKVYEDLVSFSNSVIMCSYTSWVAYQNGIYVYPKLREAINKLTGLKIDTESMLEIGERNFNLFKLLAKREGITREKDYLPNRFSEALPSSGSKGEKIGNKELQETIDRYYEIRGWKETGPTKEKIKELNIQVGD